MPESLFRRSPAVESSPLQDELILFHPETGKFCVLNRASTCIWSRLEAASTVDQIAAEIVTRFGGVSQPDAVQDVESALQEMEKLGLVVRH